jgi:uncharacterized protein YecE (DUF72 family)
MSRIYVGTAGWSYEDWKGIVYPEPAPRGFHALPYLAPYISIVEVNSTFYRPPSAYLAASWAAKVEPWPEFLFAVKLHQTFSHARGEFTQQDVDAFKAGIAPLVARRRLAALLLQFPWSFINTPANTDYLLRVFSLFSDHPLAVEVRHASWNKPSFYGLLAGEKVAFCNVDQPLFQDSIGPSAMATNPEFAYVRLHGRNYKDWFREDAGRDDRYNYLYATDELEEWVARIKSLGEKGSKVYVITNNHYRGQALANALQIKNMITGEKVDVPRLLLEKYPVLRDIVKEIREGQMDLFKKRGGTAPPDKDGRP